MRDSGFSLPEVIISGAIILLLFGLLLETMLPEVKHSITGRNVADVQEEAVKAHRRVLRDIRETDMRYVRNLTNPTNPGFGCVAISFPTARLNGSGDFQTTTSSGLTDPLTLALISAAVPDWQGYIIYYQDTTANILYKRFYTPASFPTTTGARLSLADTCTFASNGERVAEGVLVFRVLSGDSPPTTTDPAKGPLNVILTDNKIYASQNNNIKIEGAVNPLINLSVY